MILSHKSSLQIKLQLKYVYVAHWDKLQHPESTTSVSTYAPSATDNDVMTQVATYVGIVLSDFVNTVLVTGYGDRQMKWDVVTLLQGPTIQTQVSSS